MDDGAVGNGTVFADHHHRAGLGVDDHPILDIGMRTDDDGLHVAIGIHFVSTDHRVRTDEDVFMDDDLAAQDGGLIDVGAFVDVRQVAVRVFANHRALTLLVVNNIGLTLAQHAVQEDVEVWLNSASDC